ncbi:MAG: hypothetical protein AB1705_07060 [Verrucomicrobiota bacterium]
MKTLLRTCCVVATLAGAFTSFNTDAAFPVEPMNIGATPQFFIDDYVVDNRWGIRYKREHVLRVFHQPKKHAANPLLKGDCGFVCVVREPDTGQFKMWYQTHAWVGQADDETKTLYGVAYAESKDGIKWVQPKLGLVEWKGSKDNNIVWRGPLNSRASGHQILDLPEADRRGFRYVMTYRTGGAKKGLNGIRVIGSRDGVHWDEKSDTFIHALPSDTVNSIVYDRERNQYVMYCRGKDRYRLFSGEVLETGESRRISRMSNPELWTEWKTWPQAILLPDEFDARENFNAFYGMPTRYHAGIYWGALWVFRFNDNIYTDLAISRDGVQFERLPSRPKMIELGPDGSWDDAMNFGSPDWVEIGDEWWLYYTGWDGDHGGKDRTGSIGLLTMRKEGFISMHGPSGGGVIVTRQIKWPGGRLFVNADASQGELKVRVSGERRKPLAGFDYADCATFTGNQTAHEVTWKGASIDSLKDQVIRLEFFLKNADIYTFRATGAK